MDLKDVNGKYKNFRFTCFSWRKVLDLAYRHGWKPKGTKPSEIFKISGWDPHKHKWCGTYFSNDWQLVDEKDAKNLAGGLKKALKEVSNNRINLKDVDKITSLEYWSGKENKEYIKKFIDFCESGGFYIS